MSCRSVWLYVLHSVVREAVKRGPRHRHLWVVLFPIKQPPPRREASGNRSLQMTSVAALPKGYVANQPKKPSEWYSSFGVTLLVPCSGSVLVEFLLPQAYRPANCTDAKRAFVASCCARQHGTQSPARSTVASGSIIVKLRSRIQASVAVSTAIDSPAFRSNRGECLLAARKTLDRTPRGPSAGVPKHTGFENTLGKVIQDVRMTPVPSLKMASMPTHKLNPIPPKHAHAKAKLNVHLMISFHGILTLGKKCSSS